VFGQRLGYQRSLVNKLIGYSLGFQGTEVYFPVKNPVEMFYEQLGGVQPGLSFWTKD
jgi:hypothetical protein